jgi:predicted ArsR family transcriptional regulator
MRTVDDFAAQVEDLSALADPVRRSLYRFVAGSTCAVSRDQAAAGLGLPRHTVKAQLDRLVEQGLLEAEYRRLSGRRGPGAGRPAKVYRRADRRLAVSLPERRYDVAGRVLAGAVDRTLEAGTPLAVAVRESAAEEGRRVADTAGPPQAGPLADAAAVLGGRGYEPRVEDAAVTFGNCPFSELAREHPALVCGMNLELVRAFLAARGSASVTADLDPAEGRCCVTLTGPAS